MSDVRCYASHISCHKRQQQEPAPPQSGFMLGVTCRVSGFRCKVSHVTSHNIGVMCSLVNAGNVRKGSFKSHYYPLVRCNVSLGICQVSLVICHASHFRSPGAMCKVSTFRCHVSCVSCEMSEEATARDTDLEQEPAGTRASSPTHLGNMVRID